MTEVPKRIDDSQDMAPRDVPDLETYLPAEVGRISTIIHHLTRPEASPGLEQATLVHNLGTAAYHLALAHQQVRTASTTVEATIQAHDEQPALAVVPTSRQEAEPTEVSLPPVNAAATAQAPTSEALIPEVPEELPPEVLALAAELGLNRRQTDMLHVLVSTIRPGQWFKRSAVDFSPLGFSSRSSSDQAWQVLSHTLLDAGLLGHNRREKFARQYILQGKAAEFASAFEPGTDQTSPAKPSVETQVSSDTPPDHTNETTAVQPEAREPQRGITAAETGAAAYSEGPSDEELLPLLSEDVREFLASYTDENPRLSEAVQYLAAKYETTPERARQFIGTFVAQGECHIINPGGKTFLVAGPAPNTAPRPIPAATAQHAVHAAAIRNKAHTPAATSEQAKPATWTEHDVDIAFRVFGILVTQSNIDQGFKLRRISRDVQNGYHPAQVRAAIEKLAAAGYITLTGLKPDPRAERSRARADNDVLVHFRDQAVKDMLAKDMSAVRAALRSLIPRS